MALSVVPLLFEQNTELFSTVIPPLIARKRHHDSRSKKEVELAAASASAICLEGDAKLEFIMTRQEVLHQVFARRRQNTAGILTARSQMEEARSRSWSARIIHREREHRSKDSDEPEKGRAPGAMACNDWMEVEGQEAPFQAANVTSDVGEFRGRSKNHNEM